MTQQEVRSSQSSYNVPPPREFDFHSPSEWMKWIKRYERFRIASGVFNLKDADQVSHLIYTMGEEAEEMLQAFRLTPAEEASYATVR